MKAVQISKPGGNFEVVERPIPQPGRGQVRIKVEACGICHSDALVKEGVWPGIQYPRVPGHEIAGRIDAIGPDVTLWKPGQRVGVGWHGGHCFQCDPCRRGDFVLLPDSKRLPPFTSTAATQNTWSRRPRRSPRCPTICPPTRLLRCSARELPYSTRCAMSGARSGDLVAVQGIGGLGHLGIQYARQMGFRTVAVGRGKDKEPLARKLGAHEYVDTGAGAPPKRCKN